MNINLCGACGWLGNDAELIQYNGTIEIKPELKTIIDKNGLTAKSCPSCKSPFIFSKTPPSFVIPSQPGVVTFPHGPQLGGVIPENYNWIPNGYSRMPLEGQPAVAETSLPPEAIAETSLSPELDEELHIEADLVGDILAEASGTELEDLAQSLADGQNRTTKEMIAQKAGVSVEKLTDKPKKRKNKVAKRSANNTKANRECQDCGENFYSKANTNRCPKCYKSFMSRFVS